MYHGSEQHFSRLVFRHKNIEASVTEYRRGVDHNTWQKVWHFNGQCSEYPTRGFQIADYPPRDDDLCQECLLLAQDKRPRPQQNPSTDQSESSLVGRLERVSRSLQNRRRREVRRPD